MNSPGKTVEMKLKSFRINLIYFCFLCMCVCGICVMCLCAYVHAAATCMWSPEVDTGFLPLQLLSSFLRQGVSLSLELTNLARLDELQDLPVPLPPSPPPSTGVTDTPAWDFGGCQGSKLMHLWLHSKHCTK